MSAIIRKKAMKIQKRLGVRIGFSGLLNKSELPENASLVERINESLKKSYEKGLLAYTIPPEVIGDTKMKKATIEDLYKQYYDGVLQVKELGFKYNIQLSMKANAKLLVNSPLASEMLKDRLHVFLDAAEITNSRVVSIHPGKYKKEKDGAVEDVSRLINEVLKAVKVRNKIGIETTGRNDEFGTIDEAIEVAELTGCDPIIHWGQLHARYNGRFTAKKDFDYFLNKIERFDPYLLQDMFMMVSGTEYNTTGQLEEIALKDSDFPVDKMLKGLMDPNLGGTLIIDSPGKEEDVDYLMKVAQKVVR